MSSAVNATLVNIYHVCKRETWLHANGIRMEHTSDIVYEGKMIHETSYAQRSTKYTELEIGGSKIDFYDVKNKIIHETKKSNSVEEAYLWQVKYYIWLLEQNGIQGVTGLIEYPKLRLTHKVELRQDERNYFPRLIKEIENLISQETVPYKIGKKFCEKCSYFEFCWSGEESESESL